MPGEKIEFVGSATWVEIDPLFGIAFYPEGLEYDADEQRRIAEFLSRCGVRYDGNVIGNQNNRGWRQDGKRFKITVEPID